MKLVLFLILFVSICYLFRPVEVVEIQVKEEIVVDLPKMTQIDEALFLHDKSRQVIPAAIQS